VAGVEDFRIREAGTLAGSDDGRELVLGVAVKE